MRPPASAAVRLVLQGPSVTSVLSVNMALLVLLLATVILMAVPTLLLAPELVVSALVVRDIQELGVRFLL
jgi:hypothetical protein